MDLTEANTEAKPQVAAKSTHCPVKPSAGWNRKMPDVSMPQTSNKGQSPTHSTRLGGGTHTSAKHTDQCAPVKFQKSAS